MAEQSELEGRDRSQTQYINQPEVFNMCRKGQLSGLLNTRMSFVFHCNVDSVGVTNEVEGWQGAVDMHFAGDDVNW